LDFPIHKIEALQGVYPEKIYIGYVLPPSIDLLLTSLSDGRDPDQCRFPATVAELNARQHQHLTGYDIIVRNDPDLAGRTASLIYDSFIKQSNEKLINT